jgi:hypothetical protein
MAGLDPAIFSSAYDDPSAVFLFLGSNLMITRGSRQMAILLPSSAQRRGSRRRAKRGPKRMAGSSPAMTYIEWVREP